MNLRQIAIKCYELGYYSFSDYVKFCDKNKLTIF